MRIVLDTDVMVSALRSNKGASRLWLEAVLSKKVQMVLSVPLLLQYEEVLSRPEQLYYSHLSPPEIGEFLDGLCRISHLVEVSFLWRPTLKDPTDEMVLEAALNGQANWIVSFNQKDYGGAERFRIEVLKPGPAWQRWKRSFS